MTSRQGSWEWLKTTLAERLGADEVAAIFAEYNRRADIEELEVKRRRYQRQLEQAMALFREGRHHEARRIERLQRWLLNLDGQIAAARVPAVRLLELEAGTK